MAGFQLQFPDHTSPSITGWTPSKPPLLNGAGQPRVDGYGTQTSSSQRRQFAYKYSNVYGLYLFPFDGLLVADRTAFEAFKAAVGAQALEVLDSDGGCGTVLAWTKVKFASASSPVGDGYVRSWRPQANQKWAFNLALMEVD